MTIKELKELIKNIPDDAELVEAIPTKYKSEYVTLYEDVNTISVSDSRHVGDSDFYELKEFNDIQKIKKEKYNYDSKIRYVLIHSVTND